MLVNYIRAHFTERIFTDIVSTLTLIWLDVNTYSLKHRWDHIGCQYFFANTNIAPYCVLWKSTVVQVILQVHRYSLYPTLLFCTMYWHPCYISFSMDLLKKTTTRSYDKNYMRTTDYKLSASPGGPLLFGPAVVFLYCHLLYNSEHRPQSHLYCSKQPSTCRDLFKKKKKKEKKSKTTMKRGRSGFTLCICASANSNVTERWKINSNSKEILLLTFVVIRSELKEYVEAVAYQVIK